MTTVDLNSLTIESSARAVRTGKLPAKSLAEACLLAIAEKNQNLNAYLEVFDDVIDQAAKVDEIVSNGGDPGPLAGVPLAIKDNILIRDRRVTAGSKILEGYVAPYDATVIKKLLLAGAILIGRTNMDEFAMGSSTEQSAFGPTLNPHDRARVPGGSSGGSAAAAAAGLCLGALGSDTGGSVRQPASFCGLVGLKPTYGAVSRFGLIALASSLDQIGCFTKTVADSALLFDAIKGQDDFDATSAADSVWLENQIPSPPYRFGVPMNLLQDGVDPAVRDNFTSVIERLSKSGHQITEISLPSFPYSVAAYYVIVPAEASANLARYDGVKYGLSRSGGDWQADYVRTRGEGFGPEVKRRIVLGTYVLSAGYYDAYYVKAKKIQQFIRSDLQTVFGKVDAVLTPTAPTLPFRLGEKSVDPLAMYLADTFTIPANLAGVPAVSVPSGIDEKSGLPFGCQVITPHFTDHRALTMAAEIERLKTG